MKNYDFQIAHYNQNILIVRYPEGDLYWSGGPRDRSFSVFHLRPVLTKEYYKDWDMIDPPIAIEIDE